MHRVSGGFWDNVFWCSFPPQGGFVEEYFMLDGKLEALHAHPVSPDSYPSLLTHHLLLCERGPRISTVSQAGVATPYGHQISILYPHTH